MSLFCSYAIFSLLFIFFSWALLCSTSYFNVRFFYFTSSYSSILFLSYYSILLSLCTRYSNQILASKSFFSSSLACYFTLFPLKNAYFIYLSLTANYCCLFFSFYFYCSNVNALFFNQSFFYITEPKIKAFSFSSSFYFYFCNFAFKFYLFADTLTLFSIT